MAKYVGLFNWTDQGVKTAKDTIGRQRKTSEAFEKVGLHLETVLWTQGRYDLVAVFEAPDDATVAAAMLTLGKAGNVRTETLRGFSAEEMQGILERVG